MSVRTTRKRSPWRAIIKLLVIVLVLIVIAVVAWYVLAGRLRTPEPAPGPPTALPPPTSQPASCPDVFVLSIPGTWESRDGDDPYNPTANPASLMLNVTRPLQQQFAPARAEIYTLAYVAQFSNPVALPPDGQASYNNSRSEGTAAANAILTARRTACPLTNFVLTGFSQGAVIAGDVAASIGAGNGPIAPQNLLGVTLIADGRRDGTSAAEVGPAIDGVGAEVALGGLDVPGITLTGARQGGFGAVGDRVNTICAPGDLVCASSPDAMSLRNIPGSLTTLAAAAGNPVHSRYASYVVDSVGTTATEWTVKWAAGLISAAPTPPHS